MKEQIKALLDAAILCEQRGIPITPGDIADAERRGLTGDQLINEAFEKQPEHRRGADTRALDALAASGRNFSLTRAINRLGEGKPLDGVEGEVCAEFARSLGGRKSEGHWIPRSILESRSGMFAGDFNAGGSMVGTVTSSNLIEKLVPQPIVQQAGATVMDGLQGNVSIPRQGGTASTQWLAEGAEITDASIQTDDVVLSPRRIGSLCSFTKQLLAQSSIGVESFIRAELQRATDQAIDAAALYGTGTNGQPKGIFGLNVQDSGIGTVTFSGSPTWAKILEFKAALASENALRGSLKWILSPLVEASFAGTEKAEGYPVYLASEGKCNGYDMHATTVGDGTDFENRVLFGNFSDMIIARWAGVDLVVDPYTLAAKGRVRIVVNSLVDVAVRHPESFVVSTDAGNQ
jgi:HK97 family phage major capsid protein